MEQVKRNRLNLIIALLGLIITLLGVLAPGAYLIGLSAYQGAMNAYGVDAGIFPISSSDAYVIAYDIVGRFLLETVVPIGNLFVAIFAPPGICWTFLAVSLTVTVLYSAIKYFKRHFKDLESFRSSKSYGLFTSIVSYLHWKNNDFIKIAGSFGIFSYIIVFSLTLILMIAVFWWALPQAVKAKAYKIEMVKIYDYQKNGCYIKEKGSWNNCASLIDDKGNEIISGLLIAGKNGEFAIFNKDGSFIINPPKGFKLIRLYKKVDVQQDNHNNPRH